MVAAEEVYCLLVDDGFLEITFSLATVISLLREMVVFIFCI
jgi:hypothetical protein